MNENINLVEILKDCLKGTELYSSVFGYCKLDEVILTDVNYPIIVRRDSRDRRHFTSKGKYIYDDGECTLFPSKENRDWSTFKPPKKEYDFKPFDKVLVRDEYYGKWTVSLFSHMTDGNSYATIGSIWNYCIPYEGNEHLVGTSNPE